MIFQFRSKILVLFCLLFVLQVTVAQSFQVVRRDGPPPPAPPPSSVSESPRPPPPTSIAKGDNEKRPDDESQTASNTKAPASTSTVAASAGPTTTAGNSSFVNITIPAGQLPLTPEVTPGWGVAGTILLLTGLVYTTIGIKNRVVHTFFSTAYLAALGISVLIIYVMALPVSDALQGGYITAIVVASCVVGAASTFFRELTEGFGCALGGFCLSMWLMCLVPGGLLQQSAARAIFIAAFTLVGFACYFSRFTRDWALIVLIAFAGATISVLGIDCFSRAGLKEFWAYTWHLNDNLFPFGVETYPVTKGIRVETAAIVIIFLFGIISQIKLWRIVRDRRKKRDDEQAEGQRNFQKEEENVGREIEANTRRDRREWERIYGDGTTASVTASHFSDIGDYSSEKNLRNSQNYSKHRHSSQAIEMENLSESSHSQRGVDGLMAGETEDGKITVRVVEDDVPNGPVHANGEYDEKLDPDHLTAMEQRHSSTRSKRTSYNSTHSRRNSRPVSITQTPGVVPLPFNIPEGNEQDVESDRSSVAAYVGDDEEANYPKRHSVVKRLSQGSADLLRSLSQRSAKTNDLKLENGESCEELVSPKSQRHHADNTSLAATMDNESISDARSSLQAESRQSIEINADLINNGEISQDKEPKSSEQIHPAASVASATSIPVSLTKARLPLSLSKVALSYRTNEWAKHLGHADEPVQEDIHISKTLSQAKVRSEKARPVDMDELQQTALDGAPPPAVRRSDSRISQISTVPEDPPAAIPPKHERRTSLTSIVLPPPTQNDVMRSPKSPGFQSMRSPSATAMRKPSAIAPIAEENDLSAEAEAKAELSRAPSASPPMMPQDSPNRAAPISGIVSYDSPQTLIGQREIFLRSRSQGNLGNMNGSTTALGGGAASDAGSVHDYPMYPPTFALTDADDVPLSQRRDMMRNNSRLSLAPSTNSLQRSESVNGGADNVAFDSHQPQRTSLLPTSAAREAQLANFRRSVSQNLRSGNPMMLSNTRETPFASTNNLLGGREIDVQRNIDMQRNVMIGQREAESQRKEMQRREREYSDQVLNERMRNGDMLDAHRDAMRKLQKNAR